MCVQYKHVVVVLQLVHLISPLKNTPRCVSYVRLEYDDTQPTDAMLFGDDQGYVTLMSIDVKDLAEPRTGVEVRSGIKQDRRIVHIEPKNLIS